MASGVTLEICQKGHFTDASRKMTSQEGHTQHFSAMPI